MKNLFLIVLLSLLVQSAAIAQTPEPIYSYAKVRKEISWYRQQQKAWKAEIDKNQTNANAWYNYFLVSRALTRLDEEDKRSGDEKGEYLKNIVNDMGKAVPNTFEYNHVEWIVARLGDMAKVTYLKKAMEIAPDNPALCSDAINLGELNRDMALRDKYAKLWFTSGQASPGFLNYNYNVLAGLKENAILLTAGDNDTYPVWILQAAQGFRKDVTAINTSLILVKEYREKLFKELGVQQLTDDPFESDEARKKFNKELVKILSENKSGRPVYVALTAGQSCNGNLLADYGDKLYLTGLAYEYCEKSIDNIAVLKKNFEQLYALDYIDKNFVMDVSADLVKYLNTNYVVPMVKLYEHYVLAGEVQKAETIKSKILKIAEGTEQEADTKKYFKK